ncbi:MAG: hypothetical protein LQ350_001524 [Teloschistes chrysophthalmus]|nr:MAG: hypothetical protein LQ350_001524 [Niorma chrysophthalma]
MSTAAPAAEKTARKPDKTDRVLERLREDILPDVPYLMELCAPLYPRHVNASQGHVEHWPRVPQFDDNEGQLQYMTFLPHTMRGDTMLRTSGDWDDGNGRIKPPAAKRISGSSSDGLSPLPGQPPKKTISLQSYKLKKAGQASARTSPKPATSDLKETSSRLISDAATSKGSSAEASVASKHMKAEEHTQEHKVEAPRGHKRSADTMTESQDAKTFNVPSDAPPAKRLQVDASKPDNSLASRKRENSSARKLPPMLSPTLPACIEEELARLQRKEQQPTSAATAQPPIRSENAAKPSGIEDIKSSGSKSEKQVGDTNAKSSQSTQSTKEMTPAQRVHNTEDGLKAEDNKKKVSDSVAQSAKSKMNGTETAKDPKKEPKQDDEVHTSSATDGKTGHNDKKKLIVKIKIPKSLRKNCQRILQMQPRPTKVPLQPQTTGPAVRSEAISERPTSSSRDTQQPQRKQVVNGGDSRGKSEAITKSKPAATASQISKSGEKRRQPDDTKESSQPLSKRQKSSSIDLKRPHTPVSSALRSPSLTQNGSASKSHLSTPKQSLKSAAMQRIGSAEGDVQTPLGPSNTPIAPGTAERWQNRQGRSSSNPSSATNSAGAIQSNGHMAQDEVGTLYKAEFNKYAEMARSLKRAADARAKLPHGQINPDSIARREGLAIAMETALCYMLAFALKDENSRAKRLACDRTAWASLPPYFKFIMSIIRGTEHQQLQGVLNQLEAVCRETILHHDAERLDRESITSEELATLHKQMAENNRMRLQAWREAKGLLTLDNLQGHFPKTWAKGLETPKMDMEKGVLTPDHYGEGGFYLPISGASSVIEAVRAGWSFLCEWTEKENVKWEGKIGL